MVLRVTQQSLYGNIITQTNSNLAQLVQSNLEASTGKRINAPSDDPVGTVKVLNLRTNLSQLSQYQTNITEATGWLTQADSTLSSVSTLVTSIKALAEQGATGTVTDENRQEISAQARQYFEQLLSLSNTEYSGRSIFAGQKTDADAFKEVLWMNSSDATFTQSLDANGGFTIAGGSDTAVLVRFTEDGSGTDQPAFTYSSNGGATWNVGSYATASGLATQTLNLGSGLTISMSATALHTVTDSTDGSGTTMLIRPSAQYMGNDNDSVTVVPSRANQPTGTASGAFSGKVLVRVDEDFDLTTTGDFDYSYSLDGGSTWVTGNTSGKSDGTSATVSVPGGILTLSVNGAASNLSAGDQYFIQPSTADITMAISGTDSVTVNGVGKDIFGGVYQASGATNASEVLFNGSNAGNLFETVGKLVGYLETNDQAGCGAVLDELTASQQVVLTTASSVGARENRVNTTSTIVETLKTNATSQESSVEDVDLTTLLTNLAQQELAYQAVLKSSSMLMNLSLVSYI